VGTLRPQYSAKKLWLLVSHSGTVASTWPSDDDLVKMTKELLSL